MGWPRGWEAVGVACRPPTAAAGSSLPPLPRPQLAEACGVRAVELFEGGALNAQIATAVGECAESVRRWRRLWEQGGASGPAQTGSHRTPTQAGRHPGRDGRSHTGARCPASWFRSRSVDPGTCRYGRHPGDGVVLSRTSVWRLVTSRLGWSLHRPQRRAVERDESEITRWIAHEWCRASKRGREHTCPDHLSRQIRRLPAASDPPHLRAPRTNPAPAPPAELEACVNGRGPGSTTPPTLIAGPPVLPPQARQLRHRVPHRDPGTDQSVLPRRASGPGLGRAARPPLEPGDAGLGRRTGLAHPDKGCRT